MLRRGVSRVAEEVLGFGVLQLGSREEHHAGDLEDKVWDVVADDEVVELVSVELEVFLETADVGIIDVGLVYTVSFWDYRYVWAGIPSIFRKTASRVSRYRHRKVDLALLTEERQIYEERQVKLEQEPIMRVRNDLRVFHECNCLTFAPLPEDVSGTS